MIPWLSDEMASANNNSDNANDFDGDLSNKYGD